MRLVDLGHPVRDGPITDKVLPPPLTAVSSTERPSKTVPAAGTTLRIGTIEPCSNAGTCLDSPRRRRADDEILSELGLASVAHLDGVEVTEVRGTGTPPVRTFAEVD